MPTDAEIREGARRDKAQELLTWSFAQEGNATNILLARLIVAVEMLEDAVKQLPLPRAGI